MTAGGLLAELDRIGVRLTAERDRLRVGGTKDLLTPELVERIREHKADLLGLLQADRFEPFPLTDIQQAYFVGRGGGRDLGGVSCHTYHEFSAGHLDLDRLERAWQLLVERHDMLRAVVSPDARQRVLPEAPPYRIARVDLRGLAESEAGARLDAIRGEISHEVRPAESWPLFHIAATLLDGGRTLLHFGFDLLIGDAAGMLTLFDEWRRLYENPALRLEKPLSSFRRYVLDAAASEQSPTFARSKEYWARRLADLPPGPEIPLARTPLANMRHEFTRRQSRVEAGAWRTLKDRAAQAGVTPSALLCAAYSEVLGTWSSRRDFTINLTTFQQPPAANLVGDFTSTLLVEARREAGSFRERAIALQAQLAADLEHVAYSGVRVARDIARRGETAPLAYGAYVFTSMLGHAVFPAKRGPAVLAWLGDLVYSVSQTPQVLLDHQAREEDGALLFTWDSPDRMFPQGMLGEMFGVYRDLLARLAGEPESWDARDLHLIPESQAVRHESVNRTEAPVSEQRLEALFATQAARIPGRTAIIAGSERLGYRELYERAGAMAARLRASGVEAGDLVAVVMEKGCAQIAAVLGILQLGAAYVPIDPGTPVDRMRSMLDGAGVRAALFGDEIRPGLRPARPEVDNLAYVIYTSGSTGVPKGVMIDHRGVVNTILDVNRRFAVGPDDRVLGLSALSFDLSVFDIFGILAAGGTLVLPDPAKGRDPAHWAELIAEHGVTIWNSVPILMALLADHVESSSRPPAPSLRLAILSGDWIPLNLPERIRRMAPSAAVVSLGGATEVSIWSILYPVERVQPEWTSIPYGRPMANQRFYVLNARMEACPDWVAGQLYIGGIGLAYGYLADAVKTAASFIRHPDTGERLYRTGDLGRRLPDGNIEFLGREDTQVKVNGYRIELGEIEAALLLHPDVSAAVASAVGERTGPRRIVAHVVSTAAIDDDALRSFLRRTLPDYMVPAAFVCIESLPLSANGKVARDNLRDAPSPVAQPAAGLRSKIAAMVSGIVGRAVEPETSLLHAGASSVDMIRLATVLDTEFGFRPEMTEFFQMQTASRIATWYEGQLQIAPGDTVWNDSTLIFNAKARDDFKREGRGLRRPHADWIRVALPASDTPGLMARYCERRSHRRFSGEPVPLARFSALLSVLCQRDGSRLYGSAGESYAVQAHIYVKPDGVETLAAGGYYYHPECHELHLLDTAARLTEDIHIFENRPIFRESTFSVFLICKAGAIAPLYGAKAREFALIESGLETQLLEMAAPACEIGLCQIGSVNRESIREAFRLDADHVLLHSLAGGAIGWEEGSL